MCRSRRGSLGAGLVNGAIVFAFLMFAMAIVLFVLSLVNLRGDVTTPTKDYSLLADATFLVLLAQCPVMWYINFSEVVKYRDATKSFHLLFLFLASTLVLIAVVVYGAMAQKSTQTQVIATSISITANCVTMLAATLSIFESA